MQEFKITLKHPITDEIPEVKTNLSLTNDYLVYTSSFGGNLVDENNVKDFLDEPKNINLATDFLEYLSSNTKKEEFEDILYDNKKLANILNDYYNSIITQNKAPDKSVIKEQIVNSEQVSYKTNNFNILNKRTNEEKTILTDINKEDSIYITILLTSNSENIAPVNFNQFTKDTVENKILYVQGFVNLNKNENAFPEEYNISTEKSEMDFAEVLSTNNTDSNISISSEEVSFKTIG